MLYSYLDKTGEFLICFLSLAALSPPFFSLKLSFLPSPQMLPVLSSGSLSKLLHLSYAPSSSHLPSQFNLKTSLSHSLLLQNISHSFLLCSLLKLPENFPLLTLSPSLSLCFLQKLSLLHPSNSRTPQNIFLFFSSVTQLFFSRICPSNHICSDSLLPAPLLCSLPKALLQRPDNLLPAAGFFSLK